MTKLKVDMVSRELGRHKGDLAYLIMDANMVDRAIESARVIALHSGLPTSVFDNDYEEVVSGMIEHILGNMHGPAVDLLSDFRDEYTASGNRILELHLNSPNSQSGIVRLTVSLLREPPATVRVSGITVNVVLKTK